MQKIKRAAYKNAAGGICHVAYAIFLDICVFTAMGPSNQGSTINFSEDIIARICGQEGIDFRKFQFFDLQTGRSYSGPSFRVPGNFQYDEVAFAFDGTHFVDLSWKPTKCPDEVIDTFSDFLGPAPKQVLPTGEPFEPAA